MKHYYRIITALVAWAGVFLQTWLVIEAAADGGIPDAILRLFSYFTIQTNLLIAVISTLSVIRPNGFAGKAVWRGAITVYIALVAGVYHAVLAQLFDLQGLAAVADLLLHTIVPILFILDWVIFADKSGLRIKHPFIWLVFPVAFCLYSLVRGAIIGWYPYPFLDVITLGYPMVAANIAGLVAAFLLVGMLVYWLRPKSARL
ncbi:MAG: Pr6Pr family membrane protein [Rhodobacteraceae bacterium]|nr:Pr6Pr family membrane protein [Paracoccaceae bacterium]